MIGISLSKTVDDIERYKCLGQIYSCNPKEPSNLKASIYLPEVIFNNYTILISSDWNNIITWGSTPTNGRTGVINESNTPQFSKIKWKNNKSKDIIKVFSRGVWNNNNNTTTNIDSGYTIFKTYNNELYGTGSNGCYLLNKTDTKVYNEFELITDNVKEFCIANESNTGGMNYMLYIKTDGKVYGLGPKNVGFGFSSENQKDLVFDNNKGSNYLGINNAKNVYCTTPNSASKSFILKDNGTVLACGYNFKGSLGVNSNDRIVYQFQPVKYYTGTEYVNLTGVIDIITTNWVYKDDTNQSVDNWNGGTFDTFSATYFLTKDGSVYTCGSNKFGQLGIGLTNSDNITRNYTVKTSLTGINGIYTTAGGTSILATTINDEIYTWGNNQWGQLGLNHLDHTNIPTKVDFEFNKKIKNVHGGGMHGVINGCFVIVCTDGTVYGSGFNNTYALGLTNGGSQYPNQGPIKNFTKNKYFGPNPEQIQDPEIYPLILSANLFEYETLISNTQIGQIKNVNIGNTIFNNQFIYVLPDMVLSGNGIEINTKVILVDYVKQQILIDKPIIQDITNSIIRYDKIIKAVQADLCGYGNVIMQRVIGDDGTLYMSGYNKKINNIYSFNYYVNTENVKVPTYYNAKFS